ncbi:MAG: hypothetical protein CL867_06905 [Cytophagaceae bacterium]|nr:hypothetical protein [Cytophagaceae bacterium]
MDNLLDQLTANFEDSFSLVNYIAYILICVLLLYVLALGYKRYGQSMSNRAQLSKVLMIVGVTTFIIISIVKSSLALSLGLVGALSIVRFRTAIKEPEELGYFFIAIAIGLGMGANQLLPTLLGFVVLMGIVVFMYQRGSKGSSITQNLLIQSTPSTQTNQINAINDIVGKHSRQLELKRIQENQELITVNYLIKVASMDALNTMNSELRALDKTMDITFIDNTL